MILSSVDVTPEAVLGEIFTFTRTAKVRIWHTRCPWPSAHLDPEAHEWGHRMADAKAEAILHERERQSAPGSYSSSA